MKLIAFTFLATFSSAAFATDLVTILCQPNAIEKGYVASASIKGLISHQPGQRAALFKGDAKILVKKGQRVVVNKTVSLGGSVDTKFEHRYLLRSDVDAGLQLELEIDRSADLSSSLITSEVPAELGGLSMSCKYTR